MNLTTLGASYTWNHIVFTGLCLTQFTQDDVFRVYLCCNTSFLGLSNSPACGWTPFCLSILLPRDTWVSHLLATANDPAVNGSAFCTVSSTVSRGGAAGLPRCAEIWGRRVLSFGITGAQVKTALDEVRLPGSQAPLPGKKPPGPGFAVFICLAGWTRLLMSVQGRGSPGATVPPATRETGWCPLLSEGYYSNIMMTSWRGCRRTGCGFEAGCVWGSPDVDGGCLCIACPCAPTPGGGGTQPRAWLIE